MITRRRVLIGVGFVLALAVVASLVREDPGASSSPSPVAASTEPTAPPSEHAASTPAQPAEPVTLLDTAGSGIQNSTTFTTSSPWTLAYTYDCAAFGQAGNFQVYVYSPPENLEGIAVNELDTQGAASTQQYGTGEFYLSMNSVCDWTVGVTQP